MIEPDKPLWDLFKDHPGPFATAIVFLLSIPLAFLTGNWGLGFAILALLIGGLALHRKSR